MVVVDVSRDVEGKERRWVFGASSTRRLWCSEGPLEPMEEKWDAGALWVCVCMWCQPPERE